MEAAGLFETLVNIKQAGALSCVHLYETTVSFIFTFLVFN
jgi:hypothetical protein